MQGLAKKCFCSSSSSRNKSSSKSTLLKHSYYFHLSNYDTLLAPNRTSTNPYTTINEKDTTLVSSMMAMTLPSLFSALYSFTKSITFLWDLWSPWDIFMRATFIPTSASFHIISRVFVLGPIVHTIFVFLAGFRATDPVSCVESVVS